MHKSPKLQISGLIGIICVLIGAGVLIRTACFVMSADIWFDELFTVELALKPMNEMLALAARDVHPPLYYILTHLVYITLHSAFGTDVTVAAKITSILPYAGVCIYLMTFVRRRFGLTAAGIAFLLIMTMPHMSEFMVEARMYSWCAFCLLAMYIHAAEYIRSIDSGADSGDRGRRSGRLSLIHPVCVMLYGIASMYLHYYGLIGAALTALGTLAAVFILERRGGLYSAAGDTHLRITHGRIVLMCIAAAIAAYVPWIQVLKGQIGQVSESYWIQPVTLRTLAGSVKYVFMPAFENGVFSVICALVMIAGFLWFTAEYIRHSRAFQGRCDDKIASVICAIAVPAGLVIAGFIASLIIRPVFVYRYMFPAMFIFWTGAGIMAADMIERMTGTFGIPGEKARSGIVSSMLVCLICAVYVCAGVRSYNLFRWEESRKAEGMKRCTEVFDEIGREHPDTLIVCNFNQMQAILWHYLDNDSLLWGYTDETLIAEICGRSPIVMTDDPVKLKEIVSDRGQNEFLFVGSGNARDEIIEEWKSCGFFTELLQDSCFLERYYANIYKVGFER